MSSRISRLKADLNELSEKIAHFYSSSVKDVEIDEFNIRFDAKYETDSYRKISVCFCEDYPEHTVIWGISPNESEFVETEATAVDALEVVFKELRSLTTSDLNSMDAANVNKHQSINSETNESLMDDDQSEQAFGDDVVEIDSLLERDIAHCQSVLSNGDTCTFYYPSAYLEMCDVILRLSINGIIEENVAKAWGLYVDEFICIYLTDISVVHFRTSKPPTVKVFQGSERKQSLCLRQLQSIVEQYLSRYWVALSHEKDREFFFHQLCSFVRYRLPSLCDYCVICDEKHEFTSMFMPGICSAELCVFAHRTLGVMGNFDVVPSSTELKETLAVMAEIDISPNQQDQAQSTSLDSVPIEIVDLLWKFFHSAVVSPRHDIILEPFPSVPHPEQQLEFAFSDKTKSTDHAKLLGVVSKVPCTRKLNAIIETVKKGQYDQVAVLDPFVFPLIRWVISSNRAFIKKLPETDRLPFLQTPHQYLMMMDSPSKEAAFREAKQKFGKSVFAFHGSPFENWHSILRRGLINACGTALRLNGAAHGNGIYLSPKIDVSMGYTRTTFKACHGRFGVGGGFLHRNDEDTTSGYACCGEEHDCTEDSRFLFSLEAASRFTCVALCEVVESPELRKIDHIWVVEDANLVCTRFLLVYDNFTKRDRSIDTSDHAILTAIENAIRKYRY